MFYHLWPLLTIKTGETIDLELGGNTDHDFVMIIVEVTVMHWLLKLGFFSSIFFYNVKDYYKKNDKLLIKLQMVIHFNLVYQPITQLC